MYTQGSETHTRAEGEEVMSSKTNTNVIIAEKVYTLSGYESEAYLQTVASYINNKLNECKKLPDYRHFPVDMRAVLLELNLADDYFKAKDQIEKLEADLESKKQEIADLKQELLSEQIRQEALAKSLADNEKENKELLLSKTRLETSLADMKQREARSRS